MLTSSHKTLPYEDFAVRVLMLGHRRLSTIGVSKQLYPSNYAIPTRMFLCMRFCCRPFTFLP